MYCVNVKESSICLIMYCIGLFCVLGLVENVCKLNAKCCGRNISVPFPFSMDFFLSEVLQ